MALALLLGIGVVVSAIITFDCKVCGKSGEVECSGCIGWGTEPEPHRFFIECFCKGEISTCRFCWGNGGYYSYSEIPCRMCEGRGLEKCQYCLGKGRIGLRKRLLELFLELELKTGKGERPSRSFPSFWLKDELY